jgi:hypothetical protein
MDPLRKVHTSEEFIVGAHPRVRPLRGGNMGPPLRKKPFDGNWYKTSFFYLLIVKLLPVSVAQE